MPVCPSDSLIDGQVVHQYDEIVTDEHGKKFRAKRNITVGDLKQTSSYETRTDLFEAL